MKKGFIFFSLFIICFFTTPSVNAQRVYVRIKPEHHTVMLRPPAPDSTYIWIDEEWIWDDRAKVKQYVVVEGFWSAPKKGKVWMPGHWKDTRRGSYWVEGRWMNK
jgi:hypothetical protein